MQVEIINVITNNGFMEVVKEFVDSEGNVTYGLHVIPRNAIVNNAVLANIMNPDQAIDAILFGPHVDENHDGGDTYVEKIASCKNRVCVTDSDTSHVERLDRLTEAGVAERYHPMPGVDPIAIIRSHGRVTKENIRAARTRLERKGHHDRTTENRPDGIEHGSSETRREKPRRAYISLGTTD